MTLKEEVVMFSRGVQHGGKVQRLVDPLIHSYIIHIREVSFPLQKNRTTFFIVASKESVIPVFRLRE